MVAATTAGQLAGECNLWRDTLRSFRNRFTSLESSLISLASTQTHHDVLLEVEHLYNQFSIQLINIHDLKQSIKRHLGTISFERNSRGQLTDDTLARHEFLHEEYQTLDTTLHVISREFDSFVTYLAK